MASFRAITDAFTRLLSTSFTTTKSGSEKPTGARSGDYATHEFQSEIDTDEISNFAEIVATFVNDLLDRLIRQQFLISVAKHMIDDKNVKRINSLMPTFKGDFGCVEGIFVDPTSIQQAFGNTDYLTLVYKLNLAEIAHQLFRIKPFTKAACSSLRIIKAALPECLGLPDDSHTAQFLVILAIQIYICELGAHLMISTIRDPAEDFAGVLGQVPIATERDRQTLESVNAILTSTNDTKSLIRRLNGMMTWTDFIEHTSAWISHTSRILDARELDVNSVFRSSRF
ncbi:hypothetical protein V1519DRAFT_434254 [Lipomyces tetrasporus]